MQRTKTIGIHIFGVDRDEEMCCNCRHWSPLYKERETGQFYMTCIGSCKEPRLKIRKAFDSCGRFEYRK